MSFWSGTFADYGTAVGTLGLAGITSLVAVREAGERRELKIERDAARQRADDAEARETAAKVAATRRSQAEHVNVSLLAVPYDHTCFEFVGTGPPPSAGTVVLAITVRNNSDAPIDAVDVHWFGWQQSQLLATYDLGALKPGTFRAMNRPADVAANNGTTPAISGASFDDAAGVRWFRQASGALVELPGVRSDVKRVGARKPRPTAEGREEQPD